MIPILVSISESQLETVIDKSLGELGTPLRAITSIEFLVNLKNYK